MEKQGRDGEKGRNGKARKGRNRKEGTERKGKGKEKDWTDKNMKGQRRI